MPSKRVADWQSLLIILNVVTIISLFAKMLLFPLSAGWLRLQPGEEGKMPSPSFTLYAQLRFHDKWLKIDLQVCVEIMREGTPGECCVLFSATCDS